jgi:hypothetical protein
MSGMTAARRPDTSAADSQFDMRIDGDRFVPAGMSWNVVFLALAPGGTAEMSLIAFALHADVALVTSNQLLRIMVINLGATFVFRYALRDRL